MGTKSALLRKATLLNLSSIKRDPSFDESVERCYRLECMLYPQALRYDAEEFQNQFNENTLFTFIEESDEMYGFMIINPVKLSYCDSADYNIFSDVDLQNERFKNYTECLNAGRVHYIDNVASCRSGVLSSMADRVSGNLFPYLLFHARTVNSASDKLRHVFQSIGYRLVYRQNKENYFGGENFVMMLMHREEPSLDS